MHFDQFPLPHLLSDPRRIPTPYSMSAFSFSLENRQASKASKLELEKKMHKKQTHIQKKPIKTKIKNHYYTSKYTIYIIYKASKIVLNLLKGIMRQKISTNVPLSP